MHMDTQICPKCSKAVASVTDGSWCCHVTSLARIIINETIHRKMKRKTLGQKGHSPSFLVRLKRRVSYPALAGDASAPIHGSLCCHVTVRGRKFTSLTSPSPCNSGTNGLVPVSNNNTHNTNIYVGVKLDEAPKVGVAHAHSQPGSAKARI